jgi:hypothetical protein
MGSRSSISILVACVTLGIVLGCSPPSPTSPPPTSSGLNLIIVADGEVLLQRANWTTFHPTSFGAVLYRGDQLQPTANAKIVVLCEDLTTWTVPSGLRSGLSNGCSQSPEPALVSSRSLIANTRGETDPFIPYIISPRATKLLDAVPVLRWNEVHNAQSYTVRLSGTDWQETVTGTEITYLGDEPLQAGETYLLIVEADNGKSSKEEGLPGLGFSLLDEETAQRVRADAETATKLEISEEAKTFVLAQIYAGHSLYAEAIEALEGLVESGTRNANVYRSLGGFYRDVGLLGLAEKNYSEASSLAGSNGDIETFAAAQASLAEVYLAQGRKGEAIGPFEKAKEGYETLGDTARASQIAEQVAKLQN